MSQWYIIKLSSYLLNKPIIELINTMFWVFLSLTSCLVISIVTFYKSAFNYWKKRHVPQRTSPSIPFGTIPNPLFSKVHIGLFMKNQFALGKYFGLKHTGGYLFATPVYFPIHPEYIRNVLQTGWNYFTERGFYYNEKDDPLSANLFAIGGEKWKILRAKLSPAFTPGKLNILSQDIFRCADQMQHAIKAMCENKQIVNIGDVSECFTIDVIGSCAFGLDCNSFKDPEAIFRKQGKKIFHFPLLRIITTVFAFGAPKIARWLGVTLFDKETTNFFVNVVEESLRHRKTNHSAKRDVLQLLRELGDPGSDSDSPKIETKPRFSIKELTAQVFIFFAAGFETSSITLTYCLYELSVNPDIQNKVREEINSVLIKHEGKVSYDAVMDMKYLNQVLKETLRKYPPVPYTTRVCVKDYHVPHTETIIEKGIQTVVSILGLHHDPEYYPEPDKFDPERFSEEANRNRPPFTYIPFGEGPRICIGLRFGLMQTTIGLASLLKNFKFSLNEKTKVPIEFEPFAFTLNPKSGIFLNVEEVLKY